MGSCGDGNESIADNVRCALSIFQAPDSVDAVGPAVVTRAQMDADTNIPFGKGTSKVKVA